MKKTLHILTAVAVAAALSSCVLSSHRPIDAPDKPISVKVMTVGSQETDRTETFVGSLISDRFTIISAEFPCRLKSLRVRKGSRVAAGDTLAVVFSQSLQSSRDAAKASFDRASDALERVRKMQGSGSVSDLQVVEVESKYTQAQATYLAAEDALSSCKITAPFGGVVSDVFAEQGVHLTPVQQILRIVDVSSVKVSFTVSESDVASFPRGTRIAVEVPSAGKSFPAVVESISPEASPLSRTYQCVAKPQAPVRSLMPGMVCKVARGVSEGGIIIPATAVATGEDGRYVWIVEDGIVQKRFITVDGYSGKGISIGSGLSDGDVIIVSGLRKICGGMKVETQE